MAQPQERRLHSGAGPILKSLRDERGLSQEKLAELVGCEVRSVRRWEQGRGIPQPGNREPLAKALGISVKELVTLLQTGKLERSVAIFSPESSIAQNDLKERYIAKNYLPVHRTPTPASSDTIAGVELAPIFWPQAPLPNSQEFYGRVRERAILEGNIVKNTSTSIRGPRRIGKTWLLNYIQKENLTALGPQQYRIGLLDATQPSSATQAGFIDAALEALAGPGWECDQSLIGIQANLGLAKLEKYVKKLKAENITPLLCIDEFEGFCDHPQEFPSEFFTGLRFIAQHYLILLTTSRELLIDIVRKSGQSSPFFNIFDVLNLQGFSSEEAKEFLEKKSAKANFSDEEQGYLLRIVQINGEGWPPGLLQLAGRQLQWDKQFGAYHPAIPAYWQKFRERLEKEYRDATGL